MLTHWFLSSCEWIYAKHKRGLSQWIHWLSCRTPPHKCIIRPVLIHALQTPLIMLLSVSSFKFIPPSPSFCSHALLLTSPSTSTGSSVIPSYRALFTHYLTASSLYFYHINVTSITDIFYIRAPRFAGLCELLKVTLLITSKRQESAQLWTRLWSVRLCAGTYVWYLENDVIAK